MREIDESQLEYGEYYLVECPVWSPSNFDIGEWDGTELISQSNGSPITGIETIYELP